MRSNITGGAVALGSKPWNSLRVSHLIHLPSIGEAKSD